MWGKKSVLKSDWDGQKLQDRLRNKNDYKLHPEEGGSCDWEGLAQVPGHPELKAPWGGAALGGRRMGRPGPWGWEESGVLRAGAPAKQLEGQRCLLLLLDVE